MLSLGIGVATKTMSVQDEVQLMDIDQAEIAAGTQKLRKYSVVRL